MKTNTQRMFFPALHGLRGIAVLYVVLSHLGNRGLFILPFAHNAIGKVGVWMFFTLSAFLLTDHLCRDFGEKKYRAKVIIGYLIRRIFRIYPMFLFALFIHYIIGEFSLLETVQHIFLRRGTGELWAIPVEFQYYLVMPVLVILYFLLPWHIMIAILIGILGGGLVFGVFFPAEVFSNSINILSRLPPFLFGSILAFSLYKKKNTPFGGKTILMILLVSIITLIVSTILYRNLSKNNITVEFAPWISILLSAASTGLIYSAFFLTFMGESLGAFPLYFLGEISFSLYLLHLFIIDLAQNLSGISKPAQGWIALVVSIFCAAITYQGIERYGIHLGRKITKWLDKTTII